MDGLVDYMVTDGSILHGLYHNRFNPANVSNIEKTEKFIIKCYNEFNNINIFLTRGDFTYETAGRSESELQAKKIDIEMRKIFDEYKIKYHVFKSDLNNLDKILDVIYDTIIIFLVT